MPNLNLRCCNILAMCPTPQATGSSVASSLLNTFMPAHPKQVYFLGSLACLLGLPGYISGCSNSPLSGCRCGLHQGPAARAACGFWATGCNAGWAAGQPADTTRVAASSAVLAAYHSPPFPPSGEGASGGGTGSTWPVAGSCGSQPVQPSAGAQALK